MKKIISLLQSNDLEDNTPNNTVSNSSYASLVGKNVLFGHSAYQVDDIIAEGGFGVVYRAKSLKNEYFALKRVFVNDQVDLSTIKREITIISSINHKNIIKYMDSKITETQPDVYEILLLTFYYPKNLSNLILERKNKPSRLTEDEIIKVICDISEAIARLHHCQTPIIHRDIKIENILIDKHNNYVLCDFGSATSKVLSPSHHGYQRCQEEVTRFTTMPYRAPEMVDLFTDKGKMVLGTQTDIWALGVLSYCLCFFALPFGDLGTLAIQSGVLPIPSNQISERLLKLIVYMLTFDWKTRPDIFQVAWLSFALMGKQSPIDNLNNMSLPNFESIPLRQNSNGSILLHHAKEQPAKPNYQLTEKQHRALPTIVDNSPGNPPFTSQLNPTKPNENAKIERPRPKTQNLVKPINQQSNLIFIEKPKEPIHDPWNTNGKLFNEKDQKDWLSAFEQTPADSAKPSDIDSAFSVGQPQSDAFQT